MTPQPPRGPGLFSLLKPYRGLTLAMILLTIGGNALNLLVPRLMSGAVDSFSAQRFETAPFIWQFALVAVAVFILSYLQSIAQTYASEYVARDLRSRVAAKISTRTYAEVEALTPAKLLTNLTSDIDAVKLFVSQAVATIIASIFLIIGTSVLLLTMNWRLGLSVLLVVPFIGITFQTVLKKVRPLFKRAQEAVDALNRVISESIIGSALVRLLNTQQSEYAKFFQTNTEAKDIGLETLRLFAGMIPVITFAANLATVIILWRGGGYVIDGSMTLGQFTAFNSYLFFLIFPIIMIGFMSTVIGQATASYARLGTILSAPDEVKTGGLTRELTGNIALDNVSLSFGEKLALRDVSMNIQPGTRTAIIGPTAAGKTQLLYLLIGLLPPTSGTIHFDGEPLDTYDKASLHRQAGLVFQDSVMFNLTLRENIAFSKTSDEADLKKALITAELQDFVASLPQGLDTLVSERGTSLSGGQKQRVMLARALALNPKILLLDDFTARVDTATEKAILANVHQNYPGITLISVTQKIASVMDYDQIILLMEGEVLATGTHQQLMDASPEYVQLFHSQRSTSHYEVQA